MLTYDDLARACRENDKSAEEAGAAGAMLAVGIEIKEVLKAAEQRAIRIALFTHGKPVPTDAVPVDISPMERAEFNRLQAAVLDGIAIGLRAALNRSTEDDSPSLP